MNYLSQRNGFLGYDGVFRFHADGSVERFFSVFEVLRSGFNTLQPAPDSFGQLN